MGHEENGEERVERSGAASASGGSVANTGIVHGDIVVNPLPVPQSAYLEQVRRIAPAELRGRESELEQLAAFSTADDGPSYRWYRAEAWAGKSALLSTFVLQPPDGVDVVSFFITARFPGQSDRIAFTDVVLEQLAELLGEPMPAYLSDATRGPHLWRMLDEAARACRTRGRRLLLIVDGLDEDRGIVAGPDPQSVAGLLPAQPQAGMRVLVASRPNPPMPADVGAGHPLRDRSVVWELERSPWADEFKSEAERELRRLLHGTRTEQDLLGVLTSAGGGLSAADLAEMTGAMEWEVREYLGATGGRTFTRRLSRWRPSEAPEIYLLGHEELQNASAKFLGESRLAAYRESIHKWAELYEGRGWPADTPEYLLRGYTRLLRAGGDDEQLIRFGLDRHRHQRLLDVTGGDVAALVEITTAQDAILAAPEPDLSAMARLSVYRQRLVERNTGIPTNLPSVWAQLGHVARAESLAESIANVVRRATALRTVARELSRHGELTAAHSAAVAVDLPVPKVLALAEVAIHAHQLGKSELAEDLLGAAGRAIGEVEDSVARQEVYLAVFTARLRIGDVSGALDLIGELPAGQRDSAGVAVIRRAAADDVGLARSLVARTPLDERIGQAVIIEAALASDQLEPARKLFDEGAWRVAIAGEATPPAMVRATVRLIAALEASGRRSAALELAELLISSGQDQAVAAGATVLAPYDFAKAKKAWKTITGSEVQADAAMAIGGALAANGRFRDAASVAYWLPGSAGRATVLLRIAAETRRTDPDRAVAMERKIVGRISRALRPHDFDSWLTSQVKRGAERPGRDDQAVHLAGFHPSAAQRSLLLAHVALRRAARGDVGGAAVLAATIPPEHLGQSEARSLGVVLRRDGQFEQATPFIDAAVRDMVASRNRDNVVGLTGVALAVKDKPPAERRAAYYDALEKWLENVVDGPRREDIASAVAGLLATATDFEGAERFAALIDRPYGQATLLTELALTALACDANDWAARLAVKAEAEARSIEDQTWRQTALSAVVRALEGIGEHGLAEGMVPSIRDRTRRVEVLESMILEAARRGDQRRVNELLARFPDTLGPQAWLISVQSRLALGDVGGAETVAGAITDLGVRSRALAAVAEHHVRQHDLPAAESRARAIVLPEWREQALTVVAVGSAENGDLAHAIALMRLVMDPHQRGSGLFALATKAAEQGHHAVAQDILSGIGAPNRRVAAHIAVAAALARDSRWDAATAFVESISDATIRAQAHTAVKSRRSMVAATLPSRDGEALPTSPDETDVPVSHRDLARGLRTTEWPSVIPALATVDPQAVLALAHELTTTPPAPAAA
ncbi:hypothetical protein AB0C12_04990 [Actinoplanes sp. NPDC048967]|uniref:hypothetical protein n=1 Tax=Actinoplanes sp. NPDC048967 TaxID=3155269 RepID=UPI0033F8D148